MEAEEGGDGEEESDGGKLWAGNPGFISNREGENYKGHREQEVSGNTRKLDGFILQNNLFLVNYVHTFYVLHVWIDFTAYLRLHLSTVYVNVHVEDVKLKKLTKQTPHDCTYTTAIN